MFSIIRIIRSYTDMQGKKSNYIIIPWIEVMSDIFMYEVMDEEGVKMRMSVDN